MLASALVSVRRLHFCVFFLRITLPARCYVSPPLMLSITAGNKIVNIMQNFFFYIKFNISGSQKSLATMVDLIDKRTENIVAKIGC